MASNTVIAVAVVIVAVGAAGAGFLGGYAYRGGSAANPAGIESATLAIVAAGTLDDAFPQLADALVNETPGISAPIAAQTYEGSLDVTTALATLHVRADVAAVADYRLIPSLLEPGHAGYEIVFASTPEVLCYDPSVPAFAGVNSSNWGAKLLTAVTTHGNAPFAVWNASTDPNGYNAIFSLELQGQRYGGSASAYYGALYSGGPSSPAVPNPATTKIATEGQAATLLRTGVVSALITYRAYAIANHLAYVSFDPIVGLAANDSTALSDYAQLGTTILSGTGSFVTVHPAPVLFAATIPANAPNSTLGTAFLHLLLSPQGAAILAEGGAFTPIFPGWSDRPGSVPPLLAPDVVGLPGWATGLLGSG
jgi:molybdate/tungstate transport system substrate-binding protein